MRIFGNVIKGTKSNHLHTMGRLKNVEYGVLHGLPHHDGLPVFFDIFYIFFIYIFYILFYVEYDVIIIYKNI